MSVEEIVERIDEERLARGMKVTELCEKAGLNDKTFYTWRNGRNAPTLVALIMMLDTLEMELTITKKEERRTKSEGRRG